MDAITIYENSRPAGTLRLRREGLYTVLEAALPPAPGLTRLWLCGGGERADLGVMEPRPEGRRFRRRYTRAALAALPNPMEYAVAASEETRTAPLSSAQAADRPASPQTGKLAPSAAPPLKSEAGALLLEKSVGESSAILLPSSFSSQTRSAGLCSDQERRPVDEFSHCEAGAHTGCGNPRPASFATSGERIAAAPAGPRNDREGESPSSAAAPSHCEPVTDVTGVAIRSPLTSEHLAAPSSATAAPVIANQCAHWCGNPRPSSPERLAASRFPGQAWTPQPPAAQSRNSQNSRVVTFDGARYLALPCQLRHPRPGLRLVTLDGRDYLLFRT